MSELVTTKPCWGCLYCEKIKWVDSKCNCLFPTMNGRPKEEILEPTKGECKAYMCKKRYTEKYQAGLLNK